jgi:hypothetical protein
MTAFNRAQIMTFGVYLITWGIIALYGKSMPPAAAVGVGFLIAWAGLHFLPKIF